MTMHNFILIQVDNSAEDKIKLHLTDEQM